MPLMGRLLLARMIRLVGFNANASSLSTYILGKTAQLIQGHAPKYLITRLKLRYVSANRFNPPRYISAEHRVFGF